MKATLYQQKDEFTHFILTLAHEACQGFYLQKSEYPIDIETEETIRYFAEIYCARGLWKTLCRSDYNDEALFEKAMALYHKWTIKSIDGATEDFICILNSLVDQSARIKCAGDHYLAPDYRADKARIKNKIAEMLSEEKATENRIKEN